ncbi:MAG: hypothetical protein ACXWE6_11825, partial [Nitrososphaeraceae archaeon]
INISCNGICFFYMTSVQVYGQEPTTTTNSITDKIKTTSVQIKNTASEVVNNSTGEINQTEAKNTLNQLGEAAKKNSIRES